MGVAARARVLTEPKPSFHMEAGVRETPYSFQLAIPTKRKPSTVTIPTKALGILLEVVKVR